VEKEIFLHNYSVFCADVVLTAAECHSLFTCLFLFHLFHSFTPYI